MGWLLSCTRTPSEVSNDGLLEVFHGVQKPPLAGGLVNRLVKRAPAEGCYETVFLWPFPHQHTLWSLTQSPKEQGTTPASWVRGVATHDLELSLGAPGLPAGVLLQHAPSREKL